MFDLILLPSLWRCFHYERIIALVAINDLFENYFIALRRISAIMSLFKWKNRQHNTQIFTRNATQGTWHIWPHVAVVCRQRGSYIECVMKVIIVQAHFDSECEWELQSLCLYVLCVQSELHQARKHR